MDDPSDSEFFNTLRRVSNNRASFNGMLEYFMAKKPEQWLDVVSLLMKISKREYSNVQELGMKLEFMIDDYAAFMGSDVDKNQS